MRCDCPARLHEPRCPYNPRNRWHNRPPVISAALMVAAVVLLASWLGGAW